MGERTPLRHGRRHLSRVSRALAAHSRSTPSDVGNKAKLIYHVKKGDTIGHIAEWYACRAADIRNWNDIAYGDPIRAGTSLAVWVNKQNLDHYRNVDDLSFADKQALIGASASGAGVAKEDSPSDPTTRYVVKKGDTLDKIARKFSVTARQIQRWNNMRKMRINAGQELIVHKDA